MTALTVTATVRDALGGTGSATAMATILDDPGAARAALLRGSGGNLWPNQTAAGGTPLAGVYSPAEYPTARRRVSTLPVQPGSYHRDLVVDDLILPPAVAGNDFTLHNVEVKGSATTAPTDYTGLVKGWASGNPVGRPIARLIDCTLDPNIASPFWNAFHGWGVDALRVEMKRVADGFATFAREGGVRRGNAKVRARQCWVHDLAFFMPGVLGERSGDGTHPDCVQPAGGTGHVYEYCALDCFIGADFNGGKNWQGTNHGNAAFMIRADDADQWDNRVYGCRIAGGAVGVNFVKYDRDPDGTTRSIEDFGVMAGNTFVYGSFRTGPARAISMPMVKNSAGVWVPAIGCDFGQGVTPGSTLPPNVWEGGPNPGGVVALSNGGAP